MKTPLQNAREAWERDNLRDAIGYILECLDRGHYHYVSSPEWINSQMTSEDVPAPEPQRVES